MDWGINIIPLPNVLYYNNYVMVFVEGGNASPLFEKGVKQGYIPSKNGSQSKFPSCLTG